jgi:Rad3-related DNA helicase
MSKWEFEEWIKTEENKKDFCKRIYKVVDFNQGVCYFIPQNYAQIISSPKDLSDEEIKKLKEQRGDVKLKKYDLNFVEFGTFGSSVKTEVGEKFVRENTKEVLKGKRKTIDLPLIQDTCIKIQIDWLGNVKLSN